MRLFPILLNLAFLVSHARAATTSNFKRDSLSAKAEADSPKLIPVVNANPTESSNSTLCSKPVRGDCSFYEDCLESRYQCGANGYPLGYGKKYCNKFNAAKDKFSPKGQIWMLDTMECLQRVLLPEATGPIQPGANPWRTPCGDLRKKAFDSHAECYIQNGVCTLGVKDWAQILEVVDLKTLFGSWESLNEVFEAAAGCLELYAFFLHNLKL